MRWQAHQLQPSDVAAVVFRRPKAFEPRVAGDEYQVYHVANEWAEVWEGFLAHIPIEAWINHPSRNFRASHKIEQLSRAFQYGLHVPDSLVTNDQMEAEEFCKRQPNGIIVKPLASGYIERSDQAKDTIIYTNQLAARDLVHLKDIESCPVLFQERIEKRLDVRITVVDDECEAVGLRCIGSDDRQQLDIRRDNMQDVEYLHIDFPESIREKTIRLVSGYGLRFAAVDFAVRDDGAWVFLEINPNGQWAWLDLVGASTIGELFVNAIRQDVLP